MDARGCVRGFRYPGNNLVKILTKHTSSSQSASPGFELIACRPEFHTYLPGICKALRVCFRLTCINLQWLRRVCSVRSCHNRTNRSLLYRIPTVPDPYCPGSLLSRVNRAQGPRWRHMSKGMCYEHEIPEQK